MRRSVKTKLTLKTETIRQLSLAKLALVVGGETNSQHPPCDPTITLAGAGNNCTSG